jgi:hypothetical protein
MYSDFTEEKVIDNEDKDMVIVLFPPSSRESLRKKHDGIMNRSGVYLHLSATEDGRPSIYAGQARHLETRGAHPARIKDRDLVILAARRDPRDMDENWRQELEHLLIKGLVKREESDNIVCENKKREPASYCEDKEEIHTWFKSLLRGLKDRKVPGFFTKKYGDPKVELYSIKSSQRATKNHFEVDGARYIPSTGRVTVPIGSLASRNRSCVPISHQEVKTDLIKSGILKLEGKQFRFTKEYPFGSRSEATAVIINSPKGWEAAGWELDG